MYRELRGRGGGVAGSEEKGSADANFPAFSLLDSVPLYADVGTTSMTPYI